MQCKIELCYQNHRLLHVTSLRNKFDGGKYSEEGVACDVVRLTVVRHDMV